MGKRVWPVLLILVFGTVASAGKVKAALTYGNGYYLNLCGSGTEASLYTCNAGCNPLTGICTSNNNGVVMWVCSGKWNQCQERESSWSNSESLGNPGCDKTVQISLFDKKCRQSDGRWNADCTLLGYMVWYSGDCYNQPAVTPSYSASPSAQISTKPIPTLKPTATPKPTPTLIISGVPSPTSINLPTISPTVTPAIVQSTFDVCGKACKYRTDCGAGFSCYWSVCRNPSCVEDKTCFCSGSSSTESAVANTSPDTGVPLWLLGVFLGSMLIVGGIMRSSAKKLW